MKTPAPLTDLDAMLRRLHFPTIRRLYGELAHRAETEGMSYRNYLEIPVAEEIAHRAQTCNTRAVRKAKIPFLRTIVEFKFTFQTALRLQMLGSYLGPEFVSKGRSAIFSRPPRTGKTHVVLAIAYRAIQNGFEARFVSGDELIGELFHAATLGRQEESLEPYVHRHVPVIDELGYLTHAADALYRVGTL